jgi:hypothetical protein
MEQKVSLSSSTEHVSVPYAAPRNSIPQPHILFTL